MSLARKGRLITLIGLGLLALVYVRALAFTPVERLQGPAQKIYYLHVPAAIWAETAMFLVGLAGIFYLFLKDPRLDRFRTLQPEPIVLKARAPSLPGSMLVTLLLSFGVVTLLYVGFVMQRYALALAQAQPDERSAHA